MPYIHLRILSASPTPPPLYLSGRQGVADVAVAPVARLGHEQAVVDRLLDTFDNGQGGQVHERLFV